MKVVESVAEALDDALGKVWVGGGEGSICGVGPRHHLVRGMTRQEPYRRRCRRRIGTLGTAPLV